MSLLGLMVPSFATLSLAPVLWTSSEFIKSLQCWTPRHVAARGSNIRSVHSFLTLPNSGFKTIRNTEQNLQKSRNKAVKIIKGNETHIMKEVKGLSETRRVLKKEV